MKSCSRSFTWSSRGDEVTQSDLRNFRTSVLDKDDVFQPGFCRNVVFYGSSDDKPELQCGAKEELKSWNTQCYTFVANKATASPGPYVSTTGKTWQPWRVYRDHNATLMCAFKPSLDQAGR